MSTYKYYQVYCIAEGVFRTVNSFTKPTECPIEHVNRTIDTNQTSILDYKIINSNKSVNLIPKIDTITSLNYTNIKTNFYFDVEIMSSIVNINIITYLQNNSGIGTYDFRVYNYMTGQELWAITGLNNVVQTLFNIECITTNLLENTFLEFHMRVSKSQDKAFIQNIIVNYNTHSK